MPSLKENRILNSIDKIIINSLKKSLKENYNIEVNKIEKNQDSTDGNVYNIWKSEKKFIVKIYQKLDLAKSMIDLSNEMQRINIRTPKIIKGKDEKEYCKLNDNYYYVVYEFLEGKAITYEKESGKINRKVIDMIARELRKIHDNTKENYFDLKEVPLKIESKRKSIIHFDLTQNNILENNNMIEFIDFDDAKFGASVCDVSILISNFFFTKTRGIDLEGMQIFIDGYYGKDKKLKEKEMPQIKECALRWIEYILKGNEFDTSTTESFEVRYKLIEKNL